MRAVRTPSLALLGVAALAGCGSGGASDDGKTATKPAAQSAAPASGRGQDLAAGRTTPVPKGIKDTRKVETSGQTAAAVVDKAVGKEVGPGQPTVIGARCRAGRCVVRYRSGAPGRGVVLQAQADILQRLLARPGIKSVTLYVHHQQVGTPKKNEAPAFAVSVCTRGSRAKPGWTRTTVKGVTFGCHSTRVPGGLQRSLIRRGQLSNEEASHGKGAPGGGPPQK